MTEEVTSAYASCTSRSDRNRTCLCRKAQVPNLAGVQYPTLRYASQAATCPGSDRRILSRVRGTNPDRTPRARRQFSDTMTRVSREMALPGLTALYSFLNDQTFEDRYLPVQGRIQEVEHRRKDSNPRTAVLEAAALPLSYVDMNLYLLAERVQLYHDRIPLYRVCANFLCDFAVPLRGLEPPTSEVETRHSLRLSYKGRNFKGASAGSRDALLGAGGSISAGAALAHWQTTTARRVRGRGRCPQSRTSSRVDWS